MDSIEKPRSFDYEKDDNKDKNENDNDSEAPPSIMQSQSSINSHHRLTFKYQVKIIFRQKITI